MSMFSFLQPVLAERLAVRMAAVEAVFHEQLASDEACVAELVRHVERYRGKMLRPMLVLLAGECVGVAAEQEVALVRLAAVVEMIHMATLVHDDVLDEAAVRRGGGTVNALRGNETAVMLGDLLLSQAYHLCSSLCRPDVALLVSHATARVCAGELLQLSHRGDLLLDEATYRRIIAGKTGALTAVCGEAAAVLLAPGRADWAAALARFGDLIGEAFQVVDDILDVAGDAQAGKSLGRDLAKGKLTLPLMCALRDLPKEPAAQLLELLRLLAGEDLGMSARMAAEDEVRQLLVQANALQAAGADAQATVVAALEALAPLPEGEAKEALRLLSGRIIDRRH